MQYLEFDKYQPRETEYYTHGKTVKNRVVVDNFPCVHESNILTVDSNFLRGIKSIFYTADILL